MCSQVLISLLIIIIYVIMSLLILFIISCTTPAFGSEETYKGVQDYFKASQIQLLHSIEIAKIKIANVHNSFTGRLDVIHYEQQLMLNDIHKVNQSLIPLQSLSVNRKKCIEKFASKFMTRIDVQRHFEMCRDKAKLELESLTSKAKESINSAEKYANQNFFENVKTCSDLHVENDTALELCSMEYVELATENIMDYLETAQEQLEMSVFRTSVISRDAVRCTYKVTSKVLKDLGSSLRDIDSCYRDSILAQIETEQQIDENSNTINEEEYQEE
ncbi:uncharacterized protein LOC129911841 [Episyrphus balteatus]|uniref:uncharacterized protein LOC129911841 n=1 Tax=Episyrphus balteatus TaxID=286459 RepID=UPI0024865A4F|nr:uncharacterized protein LOC129911841 [Episyrphus balteatus]